MDNVESTALSKQEAFTAWQLMGFVVERRLVLSSSPFINGFARRRADRLVHTFGHALGEMTDQRITTIQVESLIDDPKDLRFVAKALILEIAQRQSFAERNPTLTQGPAWQAKDLDFAGLQSALSLRSS